ncbi:MAG: mechanosensitive ion channel family protein [Pseudomonadota bacterium]
MHIYFKALSATLKALALLVICFASPVQAQFSIGAAGTPTDAAPSLPDPLTPEAANALISRLSDSEVRALLLDQLNTQAAEVAEEESEAEEEFIFHATQGTASTVTIAVERLPLLLEGQGRAFANFYERIGFGSGLLLLFGYMIVVWGSAALIELGYRRLTRGWLTIPAADPENLTLRESLQLLGKRLATQVLAVVIFVLAARIIGQAIVPEVFIGVMQLIGIYLIGFPRFMLAIGFFFCAPMNPEYRLLNISTPDAKATVFHVFWTSMLIGFSTAILIFNANNGVPLGELRLGFWLSTALHVYLIALSWRYRAAFSDMMRGFEPNITPMEERVARAYPYFAMVTVFVTWWVVGIVASYGNFELLQSAPQYKTMILVIFMPAFDTAIRGIVRHSLPPMSGEGAVAERAFEATRRAYIRIGRIVVFGISVLAVAGFWGMNLQDLASAGVGAQLAAAAIEFLIILSFGYLLYEAVSLLINRKLAAEYTSSGFDPEAQEIGGDGGGAGGSRLSTVLPLILLVSRSAIVVIFLLLALGEVGVDTTPLLAGAGIVGLAIGFGAQKLVTDIVSGIFFLVDDAFRTGEYVEIEGTMGTVEKISIRSMQLRHHKGPVHTIPYGEIPKITNFSRDWVIMKLRFTVPFNSDPNQIKKIFKKIGQELLEVPEFKDDFLAPFKSQGVLEIDDVGMVIRGKFMCKPGTQFMIRKEIYNRVNKAFAENGLEFARREVRVALPSMERHGDLTEEDRAAISAAATQAAQDQVDEAHGAEPR